MSIVITKKTVINVVCIDPEKIDKIIIGMPTNKIFGLMKLFIITK